MSRRFVISFSIITASLVILAFILAAAITQRLSKDGVIKLSPGEKQPLVIELKDQSNQKLIPSTIPTKEGETHQIILKYLIKTPKAKDGKEHLLGAKISGVVLNHENHIHDVSHLFMITYSNKLSKTGKTDVEVILTMNETNSLEEKQYLVNSMVNVELSFWLE